MQQVPTAPACTLKANRKAERAMLDEKTELQERRNPKARGRKFTRWLKRRLARATRRLHRSDSLAWA